MSIRNSLVPGFVGGVLGALGNYLVYFAALALGVSFAVNAGGQGGGQFPAAAIGIASVIPGVVGALLFSVLGRVIARPVPVFVGLAAIVTLLSMVPVVNLSGASAGARVTLAVMHVLAATAITGVILARRRRP